MIARLTERNTAQGHLLQAWKHRLKQQVVQFSLFLCNLHFVFLFFSLVSPLQKLDAALSNDHRR